MDESSILRCIYYGVYRVVNTKVGPESVVQVRRTTTNLYSDYLALMSTLRGRPLCQYVSGSYAEGFRFRSSDWDMMLVDRHIIVTDTQGHGSNNRYSGDATVLLMETVNTRPGFALLRLITQSRHPFLDIERLCDPMMYVSSTKWKEEVPKIIPDNVIHGPCESGMVGDTEVDLAFCLPCATWPQSARGCIARLRRVGWPHDRVIGKILKDGCHMVAIGAKGSQSEKIEWRISFSFAEKTLIHEMNHCQFLCYGLLKIFLKEAMESEETEEKLLCSYFLKTAVFWEICNNQTAWNSHELLHCFWVCFRRLISWVYNGYCPNFFIPENNMFYDKIKGRAQSTLLTQLLTLYSEGFCCLLRCRSLQASLAGCLDLPIMYILLPQENELFTKSFNDTLLIGEILNKVPCDVSYEDIHTSLRTLYLLDDRSDETRSLALETWRKCTVQHLLCLSLNENNAQSTDHVKGVLRDLVSHSFDIAHHLLLPAVHLYRSKIYDSAMKVLLHVKGRLLRPGVMYPWTIRKKNYKAAGGENTSVVAMMKKVVAHSFGLHVQIGIPELSLENQMVNASFLHFPPLVITYFLLYLCHYRLSQWPEAGVVLQELEFVVTNDTGSHVNYRERALSWTILGLCQEMYGELINAHHSYHKALHDPYNYFSLATTTRIQEVLAKIICANC